MSEPIAPLRETLSDLMEWIEAENLAATIIGGVAAGLHGQPRLTEDVDLVVLDAEAELLIASAGRHGFFPRVDDALEFSRRSRVLLMRHSSGVALDVSLGGLAFEREAVERAQSLDAGGLRVRVASPEDIIIMKALARRPQDIADIVGIVEVRPDLDLDRIRRWVREFSSVLGKPEIFDDLERLIRRR